MKLIQNKETGIVEAWENGCKIGEVIGMGDDMGMAVDTASMPDQNGKKIVEERYRMLGAIGVKIWPEHTYIGATQMVMVKGGVITMPSLEESSVIIDTFMDQK